MNTRRWLSGVAVAALFLAGCAGGTKEADPEISAPPTDASGEMTVWLMDGSQPDTVVDAVNKKFNEKYPNVKVNVELQQWAGVQDKLTTAMNTAETPDVVEIGNSLTAKFADAGLLADLTASADDFGKDNWLPGLIPSGELDGQRYGIPYYAGVRIVMYNKAHFQEAGVEVPKTLDELEQVAAKLSEKKGTKADGYSAFYFPGKFWYGALPFIWSEGGDIAVKDGDNWTGKLDSSESKSGLERLKRLVDTYSTAPTDGNEVQNWEVFQDGDIGMVMDSWWAPGAIVGANEEFAPNVGVFALPRCDRRQDRPGVPRRLRSRDPREERAEGTGGRVGQDHHRHRDPDAARQGGRRDPEQRGVVRRPRGQRVPAGRRPGREGVRLHACQPQLGQRRVGGRPPRHAGEDLLRHRVHR